jgi:hypothetical protein
MAELDIFETAPKKWIMFDSDTEVLIQYLSKEVLNKIADKSAEIARKSRISSDVIANKLTGRKTVLGWRKKLDHGHPGLMANGVPVPFNAQNVDMLMTKSIDFSRFVNVKCIESGLFRDEIDIDLDAAAAEIMESEERSQEAADASPNA